jgi:hypothetical protein
MQKNTAEKTAPSVRRARRAWLAYAAYAACFGISLTQPAVSRAGEPNRKKPAAKATPTTPKTHYLVSAIVREGVKDFTFRLLHSVQSAASKDEAVGIFTRLAMEKHPGYAIAQTTVTDISWPPDICLTNKATGPRRPGKTFYAVSAVLGNNNRNDLDTLLINGWLPGNSADEVLNRVLRDVMAKYPDFTPVSKLVTELDLTLAGCPAPGPASSPARYHGERV